MERVRRIGAGVALLLLGSVTALYAQQDRQDQAKPAQAQHQQKPAQRSQAKPQPAQHSQAKPQPAQHSQVKSQPSQGKPQPSAKPGQAAYGGAYHGGVKPAAPTNGGVHPSGVPQQASQVRSGFQQSRATSWTTQHKTWQQRGGYNGYRIPQDRFSLYFGAGHFFHIGSLPLLFVGGYPRFQYDGYWVTVMDPWPDTWAPDWYETDNLYVDWVGDGYYLFDSNYPGAGLAVTISF